MAFPIVEWALSASLWEALEQVVFATSPQVCGVWQIFWGAYGGGYIIIGGWWCRMNAIAYESIKLNGCLTLSDFWKKWLSQEWDDPCHQVFGELKTKLSLPPVFKFLEFDKPSEVHTKMSDFAIGGLLMWDGWPLHMRAWNSFVVKGDDQLMRKNFFVIVHYLKMWRHCLGSHKAKVYADNVSLKYFETQAQVSAKTLRLDDTLTLMKVNLIHKPDQGNAMPNALSRQEEFQAMKTIQTLWLMFFGE